MHQGCLAPPATAPRATKLSPPSRWSCGPGPTSTTWSASRVSSAATGKRTWTPSLTLNQESITAILSGFVLVTSSICTITKSSVDLTTRNEFCSPISTNIRTELLKSSIRPGFCPRQEPQDPPHFLLPPHHLPQPPHILATVTAIPSPPPPRPPPRPPRILNVRIFILFLRYPRSKALQRERH